MAKTETEKLINKQKKKIIKDLKGKTLVFTIIFVILGFLIGFGIKFMMPRAEVSFNLNGEAIVRVESLDLYHELGAKLIYNGEDISKGNIEITNNAVPKVGQYIIEYKIKDVKGINSITIQRVLIILGEDVDDELEIPGEDILIESSGQ